MSRRELIEPNKGDKRYIHRNEDGKNKQSVDLNKPLSQHDRHPAKYSSQPGHGDEDVGHTDNRQPAYIRRPRRLFREATSGPPAAGRPWRRPRP